MFASIEIFTSSFILLVLLFKLHIIRSLGLYANSQLLISGNHVPKNHAWNYKIFTTKNDVLVLKGKYGEVLNTSKIELFMVKNKDFQYLAIVLKNFILDVAGLLDLPLITSSNRSLQLLLLLLLLLMVFQCAI